MLVLIVETGRIEFLAKGEVVTQVSGLEKGLVGGSSDGDV